MEWPYCLPSPTRITLVTPGPGWHWPRDFARRYIAEGEAKGEANSILTVFDARGIAVPDEVRDAITFCDDLDQLQKWLRRALEVVQAAQPLTLTRMPSQLSW